MTEPLTAQDPQSRNRNVVNWPPRCLTGAPHGTLRGALLGWRVPVLPGGQERGRDPLPGSRREGHPVSHLIADTTCPHCGDTSGVEPTANTARVMAWSCSARWGHHLPADIPHPTTGCGYASGVPGSADSRAPMVKASSSMGEAC